MRGSYVALPFPSNLMKRFPLLFASILGLMAGCASPASPIPTPYPPEYLPTVIVLTAEAIAQTASRSATATALASIPVVEPTATPEPAFTFTPAPTYTPTSIPLHKNAAIEIQAPGPMSRVVSPINLRMNVQVGASRRLQIDLFGEDGRLLFRTVKRNVPTSSRGILQTAKISFEIPGAAEVGRVTISTFDKEGRLQAANSVHVLLLSTGVDEINPPGNPSEPVGVVEPLAGETVSGGVLTVRGDVWPFNLRPFIIELIDQNGAPIASRILYLTSIQPQQFETTLPYKVNETTPARLILRQDDDRVPGLFYLYSQEVLLNP
jgi:hypothetical protein